MKKKALQLIKHPLIYGSGIVVMGTFMANILNLLFNFFMLGNLSVAEYGVLASVMSLIVFPSLVSGAIIPVVIRFAGDYFAKENYSLLRGLYIKVFKPVLFIAAVIFILFFFFISDLSKFFHIDDTNILLMTDIIIFFAIIGVINMGFLQAKLAFGYQVFITAINAGIKLLLGMLLVFFGYSVSGATIAMIVAGIASYIVSFFPLGFILNKKISAPSISTKALFSYGLPSSLTLLGVTSLISADIMLVKHFFDPHQAGLYAGLSLMCRIIFYISSPIGAVMFPLIVQKRSKKENYTNTFKLALALVFFSSICITIFYAVFTKWSILILLKKSEYLEIAPYIAPFALFVTLFGVLSILSNFYLSIQKTKIFIPIILGALLQIILIYFFHQSFFQIIIISLSITFLLVCLLLLYYPHATKK